MGFTRPMTYKPIKIDKIINCRRIIVWNQKAGAKAFDSSELSGEIVQNPNRIFIAQFET
jgi:hypothetical protein